MFYKKEFGLLKQTPKRFFKSPKLIFFYSFLFHKLLNQFRNFLPVFQ